MSLSWARSLQHTWTHDKQEHVPMCLGNLLIYHLNSAIHAHIYLFSDTVQYLWTVSISICISLSSSTSLLEAFTVSRLDSSRRPSFSTLRMSSWNKNVGWKRGFKGRESERERSERPPSSVGIGVCASAAGTRWHWLHLEVLCRRALIQSPAAAGRFPSLSLRSSRWTANMHIKWHKRPICVSNAFDFIVMKFLVWFLMLLSGPNTTRKCTWCLNRALSCFAALTLRHEERVPCGGRSSHFGNTPL